MNTTNAIRQVLMNELGLTRAVVREEMQKIVAAEAAKVAASLISQGTLEQLVRDEFKKMAPKNFQMKIELAKTVREHFAQLLIDHVQSVASDLRSY